MQSESKVTFPFSFCFFFDLMLIEFKSSVVSCKFHPSARLVVTGSTDRSFKIFTCYIKSADNSNEYSGRFSDIETLGKCLFQVKDNGSWLLNTTFSRCGQFAAFTTQSSMIKIYDLEDNFKESVIEWRKLPFTEIIFIDKERFIVAGYDMTVYGFKYD